MELKIHKGKVLGAMKACPEFERIAKMLWPEELEEKSEFEVGDIVEVPENNVFESLRGKMGIIKYIHSTRPSLGGIGVEFFEDIGGHNLGEYANPGHGAFMFADKLRLIYRPRK